MGGLFTGSYKIARNGQRRCVLTPRNRRHPLPVPSRPYRVAYAIYSRPVSSFKVGSLGSLMAPANRSLLNDILTLYKSNYSEDRDQRWVHTLPASQNPA